MPTEPSPEVPIMYEGRVIPYGAAEEWVCLLEHAATTATYAATEGGWPLYVEWLTSHDPSIAPEAGSELARQGCEADAAHLLAMAHVARTKLERAANERN